MVVYPSLLSVGGMCPSISFPWQPQLFRRWMDELIEGDLREQGGWCGWYNVGKRQEGLFFFGQIYERHCGWTPYFVFLKWILCNACSFQQHITERAGLKNHLQSSPVSGIPQILKSLHSDCYNTSTKQAGLPSVSNSPGAMGGQHNVSLVTEMYHAHAEQTKARLSIRHVCKWDFAQFSWHKVEDSGHSWSSSTGKSPQTKIELIQFDWLLCQPLHHFLRYGGNHQLL